MHPDQVDTDPELLRRLLRGQFPDWAELPIIPVDSYGTDHDIYRLGTGLVARLPKIGWATQQAAKERQWLPVLAPHLPLSVPVQVATGRPGEGYPFEWSVYRWLPGTAASSGIGDLDLAADDLARFIRALEGVGTAGAPPRPVRGRGAPLAELDQVVRWAVEQLGPRVDGGRALAVWNAALEAPTWNDTEVWVHGDLLPGNLLLDGDRLVAVIDWGGLNVGDPACDLQPAWNVFSGTSRDRFREALGGIDDGSWRRGRGWVVYQTVTALAYYWDTNPGMVRQAAHGLDEVLGEAPG